MTPAARLLVQQGKCPVHLILFSNKPGTGERHLCEVPTCDWSTAAVLEGTRPEEVPGASDE